MGLHLKNVKKRKLGKNLLFFGILNHGKGVEYLMRAMKYLPDGLRQMLPAPPHGYERLIVDGKVLLVEIATHVIHDILVDVILH